MRPEEITVCMLIKNEEYWIGYALQSLVQFFPHILIFDTGSNDSTTSIVKSFPSVTLVERGECNSHQLCECRNEMMSMLTTDWALQQDGDEYYPTSSIRAFLGCEMPAGKKLGFTLFCDVGWDGKNFRVLSKFNRAAILDSQARYADEGWGIGYPFEEPDIFKNKELFHHFPNEIAGFHFHHLGRSSKDGNVYLRMRKRHLFSMQRKESVLGEILTIPFEGSWANPYINYIRQLARWSI